MSWLPYKTYTKFLTKNLKGGIVEALASDSIYPLDGRLSLSNKIIFSRNRLKAMNRCLHKDYIGFNIYKGNTVQHSELFL